VPWSNLPTGGGAAGETRPCPGDRPDHILLCLSDGNSADLGLGAGTVLHIDRERAPRNGDLVWVEVVRYGSLERLVRLYAESHSWVTLSVPRERRPSIMRRPGEVMILGVVSLRPGRACASGRR
jgi:hypothetical protein